MKKFRVFHKTEYGSSASYPGVDIAMQDDSLMIAPKGINAVYIYDLSADSLSSYHFHSEITPDRQTDNPKSEVSSQEEFREISKKRTMEVRFEMPLFDPENELYYRFTKGVAREVGDGELEADYVLTVFDHKMNPLFETKDIPLNRHPGKCFVKNGLIYIFQNVNDEMGFVRFKIKEE
ncbi:DUF4221 domain-containing protein [Echinicola soli]|nr:DUF4221 domain-containing protein [Echinicola soli]